MARSPHDQSILEAALLGYQFEKEKIEAKIRELQARLGGKKAPAASKNAAKPATMKREMSSAARARIAAAQKKRWAEFHKQRAAAEKG